MVKAGHLLPFIYGGEVMTKRLSAVWYALLSLPTLYLLVAGSNQFCNFSPFVISPAYWYAGLIITGLLISMDAKELAELTVPAALVLLVNMAGYVTTYYVSLFIIGGQGFASIGLSLLFHPVVIRTLVGAMLLTVGSIGGLLLVNR